MDEKLVFSMASALGLLASGCLDPNAFRGSGSAYRPPPAPSPVRPATPTPAPRGDIRIPAATPTFPAASPDNVAIEIEKIGLDQRAAMDASLAFRFADENVAVRGGGATARRNGLRIGVAGRDFRARLGASLRRGRRSTTERMFITVLSGHEGQIQMGRDTFVETLAFWTPLGRQVLVERQLVGRSLVVRPRILPGGMVEVELWPRFSTRGRRGAIDVTQLATKVVVGSGQSIVIGGMASATEGVGSVLFGIGRGRRSSTMTMILTPQIGGLPAGWPGGRR